DAAVFELSSFQLWDVSKSPHLAVVLPIEPDHLDIHKNMKEYVEAKANIRRFQGPDSVCIYHPTNRFSAQIAASNNQSRAVRYAIPDDGQVHVKDGNFCVDDHVICSTGELRLPGRHNLDNACAAISAARQFTLDDDAVKRGLNNFEGLNHRLKLVAEVDGVKYYDDSIATTPGSAIAAVRAFEQPKVLILGGSEKGADYKELAEVIGASASMRAVVIIGEIGDRIEKALKKAGVKVTISRPVAEDMQSIVKAAAGLAMAGDVVVLSPAAASFDMFRSYADRGDKFIAAVKRLGV
ncbi:MAG TPA: UDP-N-acetylmuramoyl-L-alanine--D-glutamate ligase, partial [Candidatus Saccharimonadales bacterium]|nr:UDP-N-acetylmuramoyl-L-alanine--D-glutamate ligase [Candidatus Saccharimonadales bacterium]